MDRTLLPPGTVPPYSAARPGQPPAIAMGTTIAVAPAPAAMGGKGLADYIRALRRRAWLVVAVALAVIVPGSIWVLRQPNVYRAFARILIEPPRFDERVASIVPHSGIGQGSRETIDRYVPDRLAELRSPGLHETVAALPSLNLSPEAQAQAVAELAGLQTRRHPDSNTFDVLLESTDRARVGLLLNALLSEFRQAAHTESTRAIDESKRLASQTLEGLRSELRQLDSRLAELQEGANDIGPDGKSLLHDQYTTLQSILWQKRLRFDEIQQQDRLAKLFPNRSMAAPQHPHQQRIAELVEQKKRLTEQLAHYRRMMRRFESDPSTRYLTSMLKEITSELAQLQSLPVPEHGDLSSMLLAHASEEITALEREVKRLLDELQGSLPRYQSYQSLLREREEKAHNVATMQERLAEFNLLAATSNEPVRILIPAEEPTTPVRPSRKLYLAMVVMLGLGLGVGVVCLLESFDHRVKVPEQLSGGLTLPLLGVVPRMRRLAALARGGHLWTPGVPLSIEADAYRNVRASLLGTTGANGRPLVTILITSAKAGEGKSTTALNLAATCARAGERTLLVDVDLRRPSLSPVFPVEHELGLVDVLRDDLPWPRAVVRTETPNLDFLPVGDPSGIPIEILGTIELRQLITALSGHYHRVILDGPAVLGMADCRMLGRVVDAAVLVVRSGRHDLSPLLRAKGMLEQSQVHIAGVVFNGLDDDLDNWSSVAAWTHPPELERAATPAGALEG